MLVYSELDIAGVNIAKCILENYSFAMTDQIFEENPVYEGEVSGQQVKFFTLKEETVNAQDLPQSFPNPELIIFLSRHRSQSGTPTLTVHTPGNLGKAELAGLPRTVSVSPAKAMQTALETLSRIKKEMNLDYEVSYECTHHGPSLEIPTMFVELGSSEKQWRDKEAALAVAQAAMESIAKFGKSDRKAAIGLGGTHYSQKFTRMALNGEEIFGHMIPKYALSQIDKEILIQCVKRTQEQVNSAVLDWKGIRSDDKPNVVSLLQEIGLPIKRV